MPSGDELVVVFLVRPRGQVDLERWMSVTARQGPSEGPPRLRRLVLEPAVVEVLDLLDGVALPGDVAEQLQEVAAGLRARARADSTPVRRRWRPRIAFPRRRPPRDSS